jgi:hypothetical protein
VKIDCRKLKTAKIGLRPSTIAIDHLVPLSLIEGKMGDLLTQWRKDIIGDWKSELFGTDLLTLAPSVARFRFTLKLRVDGTADYNFTTPNSAAMPPQPTPPFPIQWELDDDRVLCILTPIAPMPAYGMLDWSQEPMCYDVLSVTEVSLSIGNRRFDGEDVIVLRRINCDEFNRRKAAEYGKVLEGIQHHAEGFRE